MRMRNLWTKAGVLGSVSMAFGSMFWSQKKTETTQTGSTTACTEPPSPYELKLVQVLFRHGARTPLKSIPDVMEAQWVPNLLEPPAHTHINYVVTDLEGGPRPSSPVEDSYRANILSGGTYPGQLTTVGMQQLYELGERLRKRYIKDTAFLNPTFSPTEVYVRSTNIVRTIESAKCLVAGLFQQSQSDMVSILTTEAESEILYPNYHGCRLLKHLSGHRWAESSTLPDIAADLRSIQSALGIAAHQRVDFILIRDDMVAREVTQCNKYILNFKPFLDKMYYEIQRYKYGGYNKELVEALSVSNVQHQWSYGQSVVVVRIPDPQFSVMF
ncbi:unnamed protein product [Oncorhynchus mykiss]|uniref:Lysophosphatidic acid phosphatase type 6 n=1 Tax=Oncorhynchus mykiss TaxID=8022 RepID=A0A060Y588_ONCMY|nr:unnamed protein product [Oncorhynchus mykiss]